MDTVKILHSADFHIGSPRSHISGGDTLGTFMRVCELCRSEGADLFLIAGDLFDTPYPDSAVTREVFDVIASLPAEVVAVSGNHDFACGGSVWKSAALPRNLHLFDGEISHIELPEINVRVFGAGFDSRYQEASFLDGFSAPHGSGIGIGVLHADISSTQSRYAPITAEQIAACGLDYLALGHIHKRSRVERIGKTFCSYSGAPLGRGFDETGSHGVYIGSVGAGVCDVAYREIPNRMYLSLKIDVGGAKSSYAAADIILSAIREKYGEDFAEHLYNITLCGCAAEGTHISAGAVRAALSDRVSYCAVTNRTSLSESEIAAISHESSLRGIFVSKMLEKIQGAAADKREELYSALRLGLDSFETEVMPDAY